LHRDNPGNESTLSSITDSVGGSLGPHSRTKDTSTDTTQVVTDASLTICILTFVCTQTQPATSGWVSGTDYVGMATV